MAIDIFNYDGTQLTSVADGTLDTGSASIGFVGKGYKNWGKIIEQDLLWIMQNFADDTPPSQPKAGQLWYDTTTGVKVLKIYNGSTWTVCNGMVTQDTAPTTGLNVGAMWYDTTNKQLHSWTGTAWNLVGPAGSAVNTDPLDPVLPNNSVIEAMRVKVSGSSTVNQIWRITIGGVLIATLSSSNTFVPDSTILVSRGFPVIYPGLTMNNGYLGGISYLGPFTRSGTVVGSVMTEFSNDSTLTNGAYDLTTAPSQLAVRTYMTKVTTNLVPNATTTYNLGGVGKLWDTAYINTVAASTVTASTAVASTANSTTLAPTSWVRNYGGFQGQLIIRTTGILSTTLGSLGVPAGVTKIKVTVIGGGGSGGGSDAVASAGGGGGGGSIASYYFTSITSASAVTGFGVGSGGAATAAGNYAGNDGSGTEFILNGVTLTARGGNGGSAGSAAATAAVGGPGGSIGTQSGGSATVLVASPGMPGGNSIATATVTSNSGGNGGGGWMSMGGGQGKVATTGNGGDAATGSIGAGGGGGLGATAAAGGAGSAGAIIIEY